MDFSKKHKVIKQRFIISLLLSILKKDTWACIKVFILYGIGSFSLFGCNEDSNKITLSIQEDVVLVQTEIKKL